MIVFLTTFFLFIFEAMFHYNIGKNGTKKEVPTRAVNFIGIELTIPQQKDLIKIAVIVAIFSMINSLIVDYLEAKFSSIK